MFFKTIDDINESLGNLTEKEIDWNFCRAMDACYLDESIPCLYCEMEIYYRTYEKVYSELMFGGYE